LLWLVWRDRGSQTICPGWPWTSILLISASQVARITSVSHQRPASLALSAAAHTVVWQAELVVSLNLLWAAVKPDLPFTELLSRDVMRKRVVSWVQWCTHHHSYSVT
jgi:hypothetical protein